MSKNSSKGIGMGKVRVKKNQQPPNAFDKTYILDLEFTIKKFHNDL